MRELGDCDDDFHYHDLARRAEILATALADEGHGDLAYRAMVLFARHAGDDGKRTPLQRDAAMDHLQRLASGVRLGELVDRACASAHRVEPRGDAGPAAAREQRRADAVPRRRARGRSQPTRPAPRHPDRDGRGGAAGADARVREPRAGRRCARRRGSPASSRARRRCRRSPRCSRAPTASLRQEAAKALVRIGDARALDVLVRALESSVADVPNLAAFCLGAAGSGRAAEALQSSLRRAVGRRRYEFATELVRSLGRLGRPEATRRARRAPRAPRAPLPLAVARSQGRRGRRARPHPGRRGEGRARGGRAPRRCPGPPRRPERPRPARPRVAALARRSRVASLAAVRVLAIDYGERRLGLAVSDEAGEHAFPAGALERRGGKRDLEALARARAGARRRARRGRPAAPHGRPRGQGGARGGSVRGGARRGDGPAGRHSATSA